MIETCNECGKTWGVTMTPRTEVLCTDCSRCTPWRRPRDYWNYRAWSSHCPSAPYRSPEWWDMVCSLQDLKYAATLAKQHWPKPEDVEPLELAA